MESLIKKKQKLEQEIKDYKIKYVEIENKELETEGKIKEFKGELEKELKTFENLSIKLKSSKSSFLALKREIKTYKENKLVEVRNFYLEKYRKYLKDISEFDFRFAYNIFTVFGTANKLCEQIEFENLQMKFRKFLDSKKWETREKIFQSINLKLKDKKKIHEVLFYLRFLLKYELYFKDPVMVDFLYDTVSQEFEYHFLSNKDTNRLDKPEWIFDFLTRKLTEYKRLYSAYEEIYLVERMSHKDIGDEDTYRPTFDDFVFRTKNLINIKINELEIHKSKQKRLLFLNFGVHLIKFIERMKKDFGILLNFENFSEIVDRIQLEYFLEKLEVIHENRHVEWFPMYEDVTRESMVYISKFKTINKDFKLSLLIDSILEYNSIFIDSMRYIKRDEIKALCYLYTQFEEYKGFIIDTENELILEGTPRNREEHAKKVFIDEEEMIELLDKITRFNLENLKLIKNLLENDILNLLKTLKRFKYSSETISRTFIIEISRVLEDYKDCKAYRNLHNFSGSLIDKYILEEILLSFKFDKEEILDFNFFFIKLKQFYNTEDWESKEALDCIKDLLEDKAGEGPLYSIISKLYEGQNDL
ncbi:hypothetical protein NGRA_0655 [Nosema granulosis]|uniref:Uncharacterized protein n=1 Tax=Nosema granulosis TaxID=83296 RepID=A0A9P6H0Y7_9MICR|nr:hypothetical protein NGRA_0655 [Nosema granulosis]